MPDSRKSGEMYGIFDKESICKSHGRLTSAILVGRAERCMESLTRNRSVNLMGD